MAGGALRRFRGSPELNWTVRLALLLGLGLGLAGLALATRAVFVAQEEQELRRTDEDHQGTGIGSVPAQPSDRASGRGAAVRPSATRTPTVDQEGGPARERRAEASYGRGVRLLRDKKATEALREFDRCVRLVPEHAECWWEKGWAHWVVEDWPRAVQAWERTQDLNPDRAELTTWLSSAWRRLGESVQRREVIELGEAPIERDVHPAPGLERLSTVRSALGRDRLEIRTQDDRLLGRLGDDGSYVSWAVVDVVPDRTDEILEYSNCSCSMNMGGYRLHKLSPDGLRLVWEGGGDAGGGEVLFFGSAKEGLLMHELQTFAPNPRCEIGPCSHADEWIFDGLQTELYQYDRASRAFISILERSEKASSLPTLTAVGLGHPRPTKPMEVLCNLPWPPRPDIHFRDCETTSPELKRSLHLRGQWTCGEAVLWIVTECEECLRGCGNSAYGCSAHLFGGLPRAGFVYYGNTDALFPTGSLGDSYAGASLHDPELRWADDCSTFEIRGVTAGPDDWWKNPETPAGVTVRFDDASLQTVRLESPYPSR